MEPTEPMENDGQEAYEQTVLQKEREEREMSELKTITNPPKVLSAFALLKEEISALGIAKDRRNKDQGFSYRGIDDIYNIVGRAMAKVRLAIFPIKMDTKLSEYQTRGGTTMYRSTVYVTYKVLSLEDGSWFRFMSVGEASDAADKSTNKAMSMAYKYGLIQALCIPITPEEAKEIDGDADAGRTTADVVEKSEPTLSATQVRTLLELSVKAAIPVSKICKTMKVDSLEEIPESAFTRIERSLLNKAALDRAKTATPAGANP